MHRLISSLFLLNLFVEIFALNPQLKIHRNTRYNSSDSATQFVLNSFVDISLDTCMKECVARPTCKALEYKNLAKYCSLRSAIPTAAKTPGFTTVTGFTDATVVCRGQTCSSREVCDAVINTCVVKECGYQQFVHTFKGNRFEVGSKLINECSKGSATCRESGEWMLQDTDRLTCRDIRLGTGSDISGEYINRLNMRIYCDFDNDGGDWLVFQRRRDGSVGFYRNWAEYKTGFGDMSGEFWFGLENLFGILENSACQFELRIDLEDWQGNTKYAAYSLFDLGGESDGYRLNCNGYSGTAGDSLCTFQSGFRFTTFDRDNDVNPVGNCGVRYHGAWWYGACHNSNLNGRYYDGGYSDDFGTGLVWYTWTKHYYSLKEVTMKMREKKQL